MSSWDDLIDKPFGEVTENLGDTVTWDGNLDTFKGVKTDIWNSYGLTGLFVKVSDSVPSASNIGSNLTASCVVFGADKENEAVVQVNDVGNGITELGINAFICAFIVSNDNTTHPTYGVAFPEKGFYFTYWYATDGTSNASYCKKFTIPNYNFVNTTLKKIDEKYLPDSVISGNKTNSGVEIYIVSGEREPAASYEFVAQYGMTIDIQLVKTLPDSLEQTVLGLGNTVYAYVVESTGIAYCDIGQGVMPLGLLAFQAEGFDKGWSTDINSETEMGVYCVRTSGDSTVKFIKKTFLGMQSVAGFLYANPNLSIHSAVLNDTDFMVGFDDGDLINCDNIINVSSARTELDTLKGASVTFLSLISTGKLITVLALSNVGREPWAKIVYFDGTEKVATSFTDLKSGSITCFFYENT